MSSLQIIIFAVALSAFLLINPCSAQKDNICKKKIIDQFINGRLLSDSMSYSGNFFNEIGMFRECLNIDSQKYILQIFTSNEVASNGAQIQFVIGNCVIAECDNNFIDSISKILHTNPLSEWALFNQSTVSYVEPRQQYLDMSSSYEIGYFVMISVTTLALILCAFGMLVQYTNFANLQEKNQMLVNHLEKDVLKKQYIEIIMQIDRFLLNRKKIWGIFFLCFSIPRNTMILFYDTEKQKKVGFMRSFKVLGYIWTMFMLTMYWGFISYPTNFTDYPYITTNAASALMLAGEIFGWSLMYFHTGFQLMYCKLKDIYIKNEGFSTPVFIIKTYLYYVIPTIYVVACAVTILPFIGSGPLYPNLVKQVFLDPCVKYFWTNLLQINTFYPPDMNQTCITPLIYISNEFILSAVLIPFFLFVYRFAFRPVLIAVFLIVGLGGSTFPTIYVTVNNNIQSFPNFDNLGAFMVYNKFFFRVSPFLIGIALAILKFEYKYVDKLNDGKKPLHKIFLEKYKNNKHFVLICYVLGIFLMLLPVLFLVANTLCVQSSVDMQSIKDFKFPELSYCWKNSSAANAIYNAFCQIFFFSGLILFITPSLLNQSQILKPLMSSHLWHIIEELSFSAIFLCDFVIGWFFMSRQSNSLLSTAFIFTTTISACVITVICSIPFYLLVEKPFKNFIDLILFPKRSIFRKHKDLDTDSDEDDGTGTVESDGNFGPKIKKDDQLVRKMGTGAMPSMSYRCGYCLINALPECDCECILKGRCKCLRNVNNSLSQIGSIDLSSQAVPYGSSRKSSFNIDPRKRELLTNSELEGSQDFNRQDDYARTSENRPSSYNPRTDKKVSFKFQIDKIS